MEKRLILRGLLAGSVAALVVFVLARWIAEPIIGRAIAFEDGRLDAEQAYGVHEHGVELFSRSVQANVGLGFGILFFAIAMGALFAVLFCVVYGRFSTADARYVSTALALIVFVVLYGVPALKYPPNPPAVGQADTIAWRTGWYLVALAVSVTCAVAAVALARRLTTRLGAWNARTLAVVAYFAAVAAILAVLPSVDETPTAMLAADGAIIYPGFPADDLYEFRLVAAVTQLLMWATIGIVFAVLSGRLLDAPTTSDQAPSIRA